MRSRVLAVKVAKAAAKANHKRSDSRYIIPNVLCATRTKTRKPYPKNVTRPRVPHALAERFWAHVDKNGPMPANLPSDAGPCWLWTGRTRTGNYAGMHVQEPGTPDAPEIKGTKPATHVSWFLTFGVWPERDMCHACDNPPCVNPGHLFDGSRADNLYDGRAKAAGGILIDWPIGPINGGESDD
jgi:hypothetical protein